MQPIINIIFAVIIIIVILTNFLKFWYLKRQITEIWRAIEVIDRKSRIGMTMEDYVKKLDEKD